MGKNNHFSEEENRIINLYLVHKKSIRQIADLFEGYGRSKINNIIERYALLSEENAQAVALRKISQKNHREIISLEDETTEPLTAEQIKSAYEEIVQNRKTLTQVASDLGRNRETIKKAILNSLESEQAVEYFKGILIGNQKKIKSDEFNNLSDDEKKKVIFEHLNNQRKLRGRNPYSEELLERKLSRLMDFFRERNQEIADAEDQISKNDLYKMIYDCPTLLSMSLREKIKPALNKLDNELLNFSQTSQIIRVNPSVLGTSLARTELQIKILKDFQTLSFILAKPRALRTSPELMYSLIKAWESAGRKGNTPFLSTKKISETYHTSPGTLQRQFNIKDRYGNDKYFDGR